MNYFSIGSNDRIKSYIELFFVSFLALYIELFFIRILSSDFRIFTIFKTLPLITCFFGLGLGIAKKNENAFKWAPLALCISIAICVFVLKLPVSLWGFPSANNFAWQIEAIVLKQRYFFAYLIEVPLLLSGPFMLCYCIGARLGALFGRLPVLQAYSADLLGAILGSTVYTFCAFLQLSPFGLLWLPIALLAALTLGSNFRRVFPYVCCILMVAVAFLAHSLSGQSFLPVFPKLQNSCIVNHKVLWSPYQRIDLDLLYAKTSPPSFLGLELGVNRAHYQMLLDEQFEQQAVLNPVARQLLHDRSVQYSFPFELMPSQCLDDVLIVGAGSGSNVKYACQHNAKHVDAVEIDPVILNVGRQYNRYYSDPRVNLICDDARHYFNSSKKKYDLIVFGTLDSHVATEQGSSVRLDAYVYTKESLGKALSLLKENGILLLDFARVKPWIQYRLVQTVRAAYGAHSLILKNEQSTWGWFLLTCICGKPVENGLIKPAYPWFVTDIPRNNTSHPVLTDDWPYLYMEPNVIDLPYFAIVLELILIVLLLGRNILFKRMPSNYWQLFFLGAAFLLAELGSIARLTLIFGTTWLTVAIVINGILLLVWIANLTVIAFRDYIESHQKLIYILTTITFILSGLVPVEQLLNIAVSMPGVGHVLVLLCALLPIYFASLIFPVAFLKADSAPKAFSFNLFGAFFGGLLEYFSFYMGTSGVIFLSAGLYLISMIFFLISLSGKVQSKDA